MDGQGAPAKEEEKGPEGSGAPRPMGLRSWGQRHEEEVWGGRGGTVLPPLETEQVAARTPCWEVLKVGKSPRGSVG